MQLVKMPDKVKRIIDTLVNAGYEAYVVGGCVRDSILGREPDDWDITTSALPAEVKSLFPVTIDTGIKHGTVSILLGKETFEVTTYRLDGKYEDGRHPKEVTFTPSLEEDLKRRDFTINAMAYNDKAGIVDLFEGQKDLERGVIRCVGDSDKRFEEDALRVMRAIRFSAQLGYSIDPLTSTAMRNHANNLRKISAERIRVELVKLLESKHPEKIEEAYDLGLTKIILPEFDAAMQTAQNNPHHCYSVGKHIVHTMMSVSDDRILRITMLLHDLGKPLTKETDANGIDHFHGHAQVGAKMADAILKRLRFDNDTIKTVTKLVEFHDYGITVVPTETIVRRAVNKIGEDLFPLFLEIRRADILGQSTYDRERKLDILRAWIETYQLILERRNCVSLKSMAVTGKDIIELNMDVKGPMIGEVLAALLEEVLDNPDRNNKEYLLKRAREIIVKGR